MCIDPQLRILINSYCALIVLVLNFDNMTKDCISMVWIFPRELPVSRGMPWKHTEPHYCICYALGYLQCNGTFI